MATYKFEQFEITIKNPSIKVNKIFDNYDGTASVAIIMFIGNINNKTAQFGILLDGFTYTNGWTKSDVETWVTNKLTEYEV